MSGKDAFIGERRGFAFHPENDPAVFDRCAELMSLNDPWITLQMDKKLCRAAFDGDFKEIYVLEKGDQLAGFVILQMCGTFRGYIQTLVVTEQFRGEGLSKLLLEFSEERISKVSPNLYICVSSFNTKALNIYLKFGFEKVGVLNDLIRKGFDEIFLRKSLGPILK